MSKMTFTDNQHIEELLMFEEDAMESLLTTDQDWSFIDELEDYKDGFDDESSGDSGAESGNWM